ncbi:uncharacterized protein MONOS_7122 [Monocercomonoides exilis]|uniref:uncharacterized protein n=1 Tax=Monocercomonoides exilis TaxID=2049356 RepID=UPI0035599CC7|nr:hypothetical protein MONOS_7122 [Monocercomonoides exilis]|eukprot:MONOS_7122.1-p1 / transcript=MONOS_7122.1 / gene=MONOS_7122 / organism=Monocercomonoides_exilis_PA203 / gene_product=unspecified product / transcript_product=unspecified product / location=Mono_scaffold00237:9508-9702(+) / protein_length=65 / sequence_SO=supercontig / SO=protein_coding / is_pseudo=false
MDAVADTPSTIVGANSDAETEDDVSSKKERSVANSKVVETGVFEVLISEKQAVDECMRVIDVVV